MVPRRYLMVQWADGTTVELRGARFGRDVARMVVALLRTAARQAR